jgi:MAF protein
MIALDKKIILASKSPRRRELFSLITADYECVAADVDESMVAAADASALCLELARQKCLAAALQFPENVVVGCDTVVDTDAGIIGKPHNQDQAREMLGILSKNTHKVYTGVYVKTPDTEKSLVCTSSVEFFAVPPHEIEAYIKTDEPYDKAGGYGIQGWAARFIKRIDGDYYNIMGLPVSRLYNLLCDISAI